MRYNTKQYEIHRFIALVRVCALCIIIFFFRLFLITFLALFSLRETLRWQTQRQMIEKENVKYKNQLTEMKIKAHKMEITSWNK